MQNPAGSPMGGIDDEELVDRVLLAKSDPLRAAFWSWLPRWIV